jgi:excisionase family DNA binding protein
MSYQERLRHPATELRRISVRVNTLKRAGAIERFYMSTAEAAAVLGISRFTVAEYLRLGYLEGYKTHCCDKWLVKRRSVAARLARKANRK